MYFENRVDFAELEAAVIAWALKTDGFDGAVGGIYESLPWDEEMEKYLKWSDIEDTISDAIGCLDWDFNKVGLETLTSISYFGNEGRKDFHRWVWNKASRVNGAYKLAIGRLNEEFEKANCRFKVVLRVLEGVAPSGLATYKVVKVFNGKTKYESVERAWNHLVNNFIDKDKINKGTFFDCLYKGTVVSVPKVDEDEYQFAFADRDVIGKYMVDNK